MTPTCGSIISIPTTGSGSGGRTKCHRAGGVDAFENEFRMRHKDGHWVWILDRGKVLGRDEDGRPLRLIGTHTDITGQKAGEEKIRILSDRMSRATKAGQGRAVGTRPGNRRGLVGRGQSPGPWHRPQDLQAAEPQVSHPSRRPRGLRRLSGDDHGRKDD